MKTRGRDRVEHVDVFFVFFSAFLSGSVFFLDRTSWTFFSGSDELGFFLDLSIVLLSKEIA